MKAAISTAILLLTAAANLAILPGSALAKSSSVLHLSDIRIRSQQRLLYECAGGVRLKVHYLNTNAGAFAYLTVAGRRQLFVSVTAVSGTRYVGGRYVWSLRDEKGDLAVESRNVGAEPLPKECVQTGKW